MGAERIFDPSQPVFFLDHDIQNTDGLQLGYGLPLGRLLPSWSYRHSGYAQPVEVALAASHSQLFTV